MPPPAQLVTFGGDGGTLSGNVAVTLGATASEGAVRFVVQSVPNVYPVFRFVAELPGASLQAPAVYDETNALSATTAVQEAATGGVLWVQAFPAADAGSFVLGIYDAGPVTSTDAGLAWLSPYGYLYGALVPTGDVTDAGISYILSFVP